MGLETECAVVCDDHRHQHDSIAVKVVPDSRRHKDLVSIQEWNKVRVWCGEHKWKCRFWKQHGNDNVCFDCRTLDCEREQLLLDVRALWTKLQEKQ